MFSNRIRSFTTLITALATILVLSGGVFAIQSGGIGGEPANPREDNPRSESIFIYELEPGTVQQDAVRLINNTEETKTIRVYPVDSLVSSGGAFGCEQRVDDRDLVGSWIDLEQEEVEVPSQSTQEVNFTLSVPETASVGEQNGCIAIEEIDGETQEVSNSVSLSFRSAIRVAVTVPGDIQRNLAIQSLTIDQSEELLRATPAFTNTGNVSIDTDVNVNLQSFYGRTIKAANNTFPILANIGEASFNIDFEKPYWGGLYKITANGSYQTANDSDQTDTLSEYVWVAPETTALVIEIAVIVVLFGIVGWLLWRRRAHKKLKKSWQQYEVQAGDTLPAVAQKHNVSWKKLVKINKLEPPYNLESTDTLLVPQTESGAASSAETTKETTESSANNKDKPSTKKENKDTNQDN